jgi:NADH-quinone oxidoreductase subunit A
MPLLTRYLFVGFVALAALAFALGPLLVVRLLAPSRRSATKQEIYECGVLTMGETWVRFRNQYYIYALLFLVFDIETVFLYPWAVAYGHLGLFALIEIVVFLALLAVALVYAWGRGVLRWQ